MTDERRPASDQNDDRKPTTAGTRERRSQQEKGRDRPFRRITGRRAVAAGLAATSFGALAGATASTTPGTPAGAPEGEGGDDVAVRDLEIRDTWDIEVTKNDQVDFFIEFLMGKNHDKTHLWLERLGQYGPMIQQKLEERGMPQDLIWLAMIESGLDANAYSSADAAGIWQFIEPTGERYGLEVSSYVDERRNPEKATDAALDYLQDLHDRFGSWYLAAASYNTGENRVERVLNERAGGQKGVESVFWKISNHLPRETRDYVPVMLAMGHIGKDPAKYGFTGIELQEPLAYDTVTLPGGTRLEDVAQAVGVDPDSLYDLNPELVRQMTPPDREWEVRLPEGSTDTFLANWTGAQESTGQPA